MACRGPDDHGTWIARHTALGQRRPAIIDLPGGRQPMSWRGMSEVEPGTIVRVDRDGVHTHPCRKLGAREHTDDQVDRVTSPYPPHAPPSKPAHLKRSCEVRT